MKRLFFVGLAACLITLSSFISEKNVPEVLNTFYKTFNNAQDVNWTEVDDMVRINFTLNGHSHHAYYMNATLVVVATEIQIEELPETLRFQLAELKGTITEVYQMNKNNRKEYCVTLDTASKRIVLKGTNKWRVLFEEKK